MTTSQQQDAGAQTGQTPQRKMKVAVAGLGSGARQVIAAMENADFLELVAAADVRQEALDAFQTRFQGRAYDSVEKLARTLKWKSSGFPPPISSTANTPSPPPSTVSTW